MKSRPFAYHRPSSIAEALVMLDELDNPKIIAGGQTLVAMLNLRVSEIDNLVDLGELAELKKINIIDGYIEVGAMVTQTELADYKILEKELPILKFALSHVGHLKTTKNLYATKIQNRLSPKISSAVRHVLSPYMATVTGLGYSQLFAAYSRKRSK